MDTDLKKEKLAADSQIKNVATDYTDGHRLKMKWSWMADAFCLRLNL